MTGRPLIAEVLMRFLYPLLLAASIWVLLRGHNAPGGGFIAGLLAVAASAAYALVFDAEQALRRLPLGPVRLAAGGVLLALLSGLLLALAHFLGTPLIRPFRLIQPVRFSTRSSPEMALT